MKLKPHNILFSLAGLKSKIHYEDDGRYAPYTQRLVGDGINIQFDPFYFSNAASFHQDQSVSNRPLVVLSAYSYLTGQYITRCVLEHEAVHYEQAQSKIELYGDYRAISFHPQTQYRLTKIQEAEAHGYECVKITEDFRQTRDETCLRQVMGPLSDLLRLFIGKDDLPRDLSIDDINRFVDAHPDNDRNLANFIVRFSQHPMYSTYPRMDEAFYGAMVSRPTAAAKVICNSGFENPAKDLFRLNLSKYDLTRFVAREGQGYWPYLNRNRRALIVDSTFALTSSQTQSAQAVAEQLRLRYP